MQVWKCSALIWWRGAQHRFKKKLHPFKKKKKESLILIFFWGVEYDVECFCGATGADYTKYGESDNCRENGRGGKWAINVYTVWTNNSFLKNKGKLLLKLYLTFFKKKFASQKQCEITTKNLPHFSYQKINVRRAFLHTLIFW